MPRIYCIGNTPRHYQILKPRHRMILYIIKASKHLTIGTKIPVIRIKYSLLILKFNLNIIRKSLSVSIP